MHHSHLHFFSVGFTRFIIIDPDGGVGAVFTSSLSVHSFQPGHR
jgi:hypothetical protein